MNCSDFRRRLLIDPRSPELADAAKAYVCDDAPTRLAEALTFEKQLEFALDVAVPAGLADRIIAALPRDTKAAPPVARVRPWWPLALAASVAMIALVSVNLLRTPSATDALISASVQHLSHEPYALTRTGRVPAPLVERMFTEAGLRLDQSGLALSYLNRCPLEKRWSVHMVMTAPEGPVTVMYVPGESRVERMDTRHDMVAVRTLPFADGALVLLAESNRDFDNIESAWHAAAGEALTRAAGSL
jgi:hypothetical protein